MGVDRYTCKTEVNTTLKPESDRTVISPTLRKPKKHSRAVAHSMVSGLCWSIAHTCRIFSSRSGVIGSLGGGVPITLAYNALIPLALAPIAPWNQRWDC